MSYGYFVHLEVEERRRNVLGGPSWEHGAIRFANDNFPDWPEHRVIETLREMRWPDRRVSPREVGRELQRRVSAGERSQWIEEVYAA